MDLKNTSSPQQLEITQEMIRVIQDLETLLTDQFCHGQSVSVKPPMLETSMSMPVDQSGGNKVARTASEPFLPLRQDVGFRISIDKLKSDLYWLTRDLDRLKKFHDDVQGQLRYHLKSLNGVVQELRDRSLFNFYAKEMVERITKNIFNLTCRIPSLPGKSIELDVSNSAINDDLYVPSYLPGLHKNKEELTQCETYGEVIKNLKNLPFESKMCLMSLAVFPENAVVNKTMLMYWWIAEGVVPVQGAEKVAKSILKDFVEKGLIEPIEDRHKMEPASYRMPPLVHSAVVVLSMAVRLFDIYDEQGIPAMKKSEKKKVCLVEASSSKDEAKMARMAPKDIETVFNVSERFPDFTFKWFKVMKSLRVLYLGRWERTANRYIEVESKLMKNLRGLKELRFLSLQGILTIRSLSSSICELRKLMILDLRACSNLERIPERMDSLTNLIYLDMSGCNNLEKIPLSVAWLKNLEVLKGFVVTDTEEVCCELSHLKHLKKLTKLSITINTKEFAMDELVEAIVQLQAIKNLKVAWGGTAIVDMGKKKAGTEENSRVEKVKTVLEGRQHARRHVNVQDRPGYQLHKLDLQCFPDTQLPDCFLPQNLITLKKFYIKGGSELTGLGDLPEKPTKCAVEVLRLKFLPKLRVEWRDLKKVYFPRVKLVETYECPGVTFSPSDAMGIWRLEDEDP